jgi:hypothetical protein
MISSTTSFFDKRSKPSPIDSLKDFNSLRLDTLMRVFKTTKKVEKRNSTNVTYL